MGGKGREGKGRAELTDRKGRPGGLLLDHFRTQIPALGHECGRVRVDVLLCERHVRERL